MMVLDYARQLPKRFSAWRLVRYSLWAVVVLLVITFAAIIAVGAAWPGYLD